MNAQKLIAYLNMNLVEAHTMRAKYANEPARFSYWHGVINTIELMIKKVFELEAEQNG